MENSQPLATESFSYSWLTEKQPPSSDYNLRQNFHENSKEYEENFNFDVPVTTSPSEIIHAEEIFSHGQIKPVYVDISKLKTLKTSASLPASPVFLCPSKSPFPGERNRCYIVRRWKKSSKKILQKCFRFVKPLCKTIERLRKSGRVDDLERKVFEVQSLSNSVEASPRPSSAYSVVEWSDLKKIGSNFDFYYHGMENVKDWRSSPNNYMISPYHSSYNAWCDDENSIHEAILYCKRSIEK